MTAMEDYLQCSPSHFPLPIFSTFSSTSMSDCNMPSFPPKLSREEAMAAFPKPPTPQASSSTDARGKMLKEQSRDNFPKPAAPKTTSPTPSSPNASPPEAAPLPPRRPPIAASPQPHYMQHLLTLNPQDPNGPLIYDMMANRSSRWRSKHLRSSILPPGWKMGISRLGRVPVYDPLYAPFPPSRAHDEVEPPITVRRERIVREPLVPPRYQATDPQHDFATDEFNLGLPSHLAALHHETMRRHGASGGRSVGVRRGRVPWIPPNLGGRGRVPTVVDDDQLDEELVDPSIDVLERPTMIRRSTFPLADHGVLHRPAHDPDHRVHHRPGHGHGHGHGHTRNDILEQELVNEELEHEVDSAAAAAEIEALQREMDIQEARRRAEHMRLREEHARLYRERAARRDTEQELAARERQLAMVEAERVADELAHRGRVGHGYKGVHSVRGEHRGPRVVRDRLGHPVIVDEHPHHRELVHISRNVVIDPHHLTHIGHPHHSPVRHHRPARRVHFAEDLASSEEERIERHGHRLAQEAHPRRRRFDRDGRPYLFHEDELDYAREGLHGDEEYDSAEEYYGPHERLLMPPRVVLGNYWDEFLDGNDD